MQLIKTAARMLLSPGMLGRLRTVWRVARQAGWAGIVWEVRHHAGAHADYSRWVELHGTLTPARGERIAQRIKLLANPPLISVVMPSYNPHPAWLREAIESVRSQLYPHWELCIADDASPSSEVRELLRTYARDDARIKVVLREANGHISASSNSALDLASGRWIALMDHDDLLPADALFWIAERIHTHPDTKLIYSDEDKVDELGRRFGPYFKPDWNLDLFRSQNMFSHLGALETRLVRDVGGFRLGLEGSQDWDLVLRCAERLAPHQIQHIPRILYHWRVHSESTASSMDAKPYAALAGERALREHFERTGVRAKAEHLPFGYHVTYAAPDPAPLVSIVVRCDESIDGVRVLLASLLRMTDYKRYEVILVSTQVLSVELGPVEPVKVTTLEVAVNASTAAMVNAGVQRAAGELVLLMDGDLKVKSASWLTDMVSVAMQQGVGSVGARIWQSNMTIDHAGLILGLDGVVGRPHHGMPAGRYGYGGRAALCQSFTALSGACLLFKKKVFEQVGGFDAASFPELYADVDFCLRLYAAGLRNVWTPDAELVRQAPTPVTSRTRVPEGLAATLLRKRWGALIANDPAYNPNLSLERDGFMFAWPPRVQEP